MSTPEEESRPQAEPGSRHDSGQGGPRPTSDALPEQGGTGGAASGGRPAPDQGQQPAPGSAARPVPEQGQQPGTEQSPRFGSYGEIAPGVPRYGQYAPEGYRPPQNPAAAHPAPGQAGQAGQPAVPGPGWQTGPSGGWAQGANGAQGGPGGANGNGIHVAPPRPVEISFRLILLAGLIEAIVVVLGVVAFMTPTGQSTATQMLHDMGLEDQSLLQPLLITSLVLSAIGVGLYVLIAFQVRKGRNWARITGAVFAALSVFSLLQPNVITIVQVVLGIIAEIILFRPPAKDYFKPRGGPFKR
ncbi:MAG TPA: hypothetical protein VGN49_14060 [Micrococcaceae bacterium]|nr:hypothetical protein [Micrococcaceae bacterium]